MAGWLCRAGSLNLLELPAGAVGGTALSVVENGGCSSVHVCVQLCIT